jgi:colanic acid biosynthesis glycosyl transferase WcaI
MKLGLTKNKSSLKLLLYSINYAPELTGIGKYNAEMCEWFVKNGHQVRVVTAQPYYPEWKVFPGYKAWRYSRETVNGVHVTRCPLWVPKHPGALKRALHLWSYACSSVFGLLKQLRFKPDVVFFIEPTFFCFPGALMMSKLSAAKPVLHIQDFEIEVAFSLGMMKCNFLQKLLLKFESWVFRKCCIVSTITPIMRQKLLEKSVPEEKAVLFPNWADTDNIKPLPYVSPLRAQLNIKADKIVALYSGNMGEKQGLEIIIELANQLVEDTSLVFVMCGAGSYLDNLKKRAQDYKLNNILWLDLQPLDKLNNLLNLADIHLLPQRADVKDQVMPSKLLGMLASGRPILATAFPNTQLYNVVKLTGMTCLPNDLQELAKNLKELAGSQDLRAQLGYQARMYAEQNFSKEVILKAYEAKLMQLIG